MTHNSTTPERAKGERMKRPYRVECCGRYDYEYRCVATYHHKDRAIDEAKYRRLKDVTNRVSEDLRWREWRVINYHEPRIAVWWYGNEEALLHPPQAAAYKRQWEAEGRDALAHPVVKERLADAADALSRAQDRNDTLQLALDMQIAWRKNLEALIREHGIEPGKEPTP